MKALRLPLPRQHGSSPLALTRSQSLRPLCRCVSQFWLYFRDLQPFSLDKPHAFLHPHLPATVYPSPVALL